ncbi:MAG: HIT domain-containing protein [Mariprofundaceae bacterium]|nr:HIT domain-containing protein [Mariprofundaceae bacterium]
MFELHPRLEADCVSIGSFPLCTLLLMNDCNYPWFILVPQREGVREIYELSEEDQRQLLWESSTLSRAIADHFNADKINVAALGNMVPQLHIHHIVRYRSDAAWPEPVWGHAAAAPYSKQKLSEMVATLTELMPGSFRACVSDC